MKHFLLALSLLGLFSGCDWDKYFGYQNEAQALANHTEISGTVQNLFTGQPVKNALVRFGTQETLTDTGGFYNFNYILSDDEQRNKPTPFAVEKHNYYSHFGETKLLPGTDEYNFDLVYAAPIIVDTKRRPMQELICQAIIRDYQGIASLQSVDVIYIENDVQGNVADSVRQTMKMVKLVSTQEAYYQLKTEISARTAPYYYVQVTDNEGYSDRLFHTTNPTYPDHLLFEVY